MIITLNSRPMSYLPCDVDFWKLTWVIEFPVTSCKGNPRIFQVVAQQQFCSQWRMCFLRLLLELLNYQACSEILFLFGNFDCYQHRGTVFCLVMNIVRMSTFLPDLLRYLFLIIWWSMLQQTVMKLMRKQRHLLFSRKDVSKSHLKMLTPKRLLSKLTNMLSFWRAHVNFYIIISGCPYSNIAKESQHAGL